MLALLSSKEIFEITITILQAYHQREQERLAEILEGCESDNRWFQEWDRAKEHFSDKKEALAYFTRYIQGQLDGGNCPILSFDKAPIDELLHSKSKLYLTDSEPR